jgi:hypothetical protein
MRSQGLSPARALVLLTVLAGGCSPDGSVGNETCATSGGAGCSDQTHRAVSEVRQVNGKPQLFVNGKQLDSVAANIYYYGADDNGPIPGYRTEQWVSSMNSLVDSAAKNGANIVMANIWWGDIDTSTTRPTDIAQNLDFSNLDQVMTHAVEKKISVILIPQMWPNYPGWWKQENSFPPYNTNSTCDFCETDSYGNVYSNHSMNSDRMHQDFGAYLVAVIQRYRSHPALIGWSFGVGATAEDNYGPNYIELMGVNGASHPEQKPRMYTDYSPFFAREFKKWMTEKYKTDEALRKAWQDDSVSLSALAVPRPDDMIQGTEDPILFPDPSDGWFGFDKSALTTQGLDFYAFRNHMRVEERTFYSRLFRENDPDHILLLNGGLNDDIFDDPKLCDGLTANVNLGFYVQINGQTRNTYYHTLSLMRTALEHQKIFLMTAENRSDATPASGGKETAGQLRYLETFGEAVRCEGALFAYTVDLIDPQGKKWEPTWSSSEAASAAGKVVSYTPTGDCACSLVRALYESESCSTKATDSKGCGLIDEAYHSFCGVPKESSSGSDGGTDDGSANGGGRCGDGTCDAMERQSGLCAQDCT